jgi:hypothetical protein
MSRKGVVQTPFGADLLIERAPVLPKRRDESSDFFNNVGFSRHKQVVARMTPAKHSCTRHALLECTACRSVMASSNRSNSGSGVAAPMSCGLAKMANAGTCSVVNCWPPAIIDVRAAANGFGWRLSLSGSVKGCRANGRWARRRGWQAGKVLLKLTWDIEGVSIRSFEIDQTRDPLSMRHAEVAHLLAGVGVPN